jgi:hypothetical protein
MWRGGGGSGDAGAEGSPGVCDANREAVAKRQAVSVEKEGREAALVTLRA